MTIPQLAELRDEYQRKSGHTPENVAQNRKRTDTEEETEQIRETTVGGERERLVLTQGSVRRVDNEWMVSLTTAFPSVDVSYQLQKLEKYLRDNPDKRPKGSP